MEIWRYIDDFPLYEVSSYGRIKNTSTGRIMRLSQNQYGIVYVGLWRDGKQDIRGVARLVAKAFIPQQYRTFDTPINLDGDRHNNHVENLVWRPRWFAVKYNRQFEIRYRNHIPFEVEDLDTGDVFDNSFHCAIHNGVLEEDVVISIINKTNVWPVDKYFGIVEE